MRIFFTTVLFILLSSLLSLFAQEYKPVVNTTRFSFIPDSLFNGSLEKQFPNDNFIILHKQTHTEISDDGRSIMAHTYHHVRVKILKEKGVQASVVGIPYLHFSEMENVIHIEAFSYFNNELHRLDTNTVKTIAVNDKVSFKEFQIPATKVGSVLEYRYTTQRRYIEELPEFYFQHEVPVLFAAVSYTQARYVRYKEKIQNPVVSVSYDTIVLDTTRAFKLFTRRYADPIVTQLWSAQQIPAFSVEPFVLKANEFRMSLKLNWSEFGIPLQVIESNWDLVSAELIKNKGLESAIESAGKWSNWGKELKQKTKSKTLQEVSDSIFTFVQSMAEFNGQKTVFTEKSPDSLWVEPIQDAAVINFALIAALRGAGFKAYPLLATSIHHTKLTDVYPTKYLFEYGFTAIEGESGDIRFYDPTDKVAHPNMIPTEFVNQKGLLLRGIKNYKWINLLNSVSVFEQQLWLKGELSNDGTLNAVLRGDARGFIARDMREKMRKNEDLRDHFKALLFDRYWKTKLEPVNIIADNADSVVFEFAFVLENAASVIEKGMAFKPLVVAYLNQNPFEKNNRNLPIQFKAQEQLVLNAYIKVPDGFASGFKAGQLQYGLEGAFIQWRQFDSNHIDFRFEVQLNQLEYEPGLYSMIKKLYDTWKELSDREWVIIKK